MFCVHVRSTLRGSRLPYVGYPCRLYTTMATINLSFQTVDNTKIYTLDDSCIEVDEGCRRVSACSKRVSTITIV